MPSPPEIPATHPDLTGVILAGGRSSRMGRDKATLTVNGRSLFEGVVRVLRPLCAGVLIAGDRSDLARPDLPCHPDLYPGSALGGLYTGLKKAATEWIVVLPCDLPFPDPSVLRCLIDHRQEVDAVVPRTPHGLEPLVACYRRSCLAPMRRMLESGEYRIYDLYPEIRVRYLEASELPPGWERALLNVNTPDELAPFIS